MGWRSTINVELLLSAAIEISELQQQLLKPFSTSVADRQNRSYRTASSSSAIAAAAVSLDTN